MGPIPANYNLFVSTVNVLLGQAYADDSVKSLYNIFCTVVPSSGRQNVYGWRGLLPKTRLWVGPRVTVQSALQTYTLVNLPYEGPTIEVDMFDLADDQYGSYFRDIPDQARQVRRLPDEWTRDLLEAQGNFATGPIQLGLDGLSNWSQAHPIDFYAPAAGTYSNDLTGGGQTINGILVGGAFSPTSWATANEYMRTLKGEDGEPLGVMPSHAMFPEQLRTEADLVLKSVSFAPPAWATITGQVGAADNPFKRWAVEPLYNTYLKSATKWYLQDNTKAHKAMTWQQREAPVFTQRVSPSDPNVFENHQLLYGVYGRGTPGWSFPWLMLRSGP